jgi:hypothetical protein
VKTLTCILAAGAILAFAAPAAFSATGSIPADPVSGYDHPITTTAAQKLVKAALTSKHQAATIKALRVRNKALAASNKALSAANGSLSLRILALTNPTSATDSASQNTVLACVSTADPARTIDYPDSYDWNC